PSVEPAAVIADRIVGKPWDNESLCDLVREALDFHDSVRRRRETFDSVDRERRHLRAAVEIASDIQRCVMPAGEVFVRGAEASCFFTAYQHATGDYVDVLSVPDGRTAVVMGDVCGHGLGAALYVFSARALLRSGLSQGNTLSTVLEQANGFLCSDMEAGRFMTLFAGLYDGSSRELSYINAGHAPPLVVGANCVRDVRRTAMPLGILEESTYRAARSIVLDPEETLLLYTDGAVEARQGDGELFGRQRLERFLMKRRSSAPRGLLRHLWNELLDFAGAEGTCDDLALLALRPQEVPDALRTAVPTGAGAARRGARGRRAREA
ncbi:MAG: PP2C family protein-serine/threonine phosphatase, partial [Planctomycetota bacterium]